LADDASQPAPKGAGYLAPYKVLDLTDHRGLLAGHMLAQLGAEVIQVEPPGGSPARRTPPFAPAWPDGETSLFWAAYASGKLGVTCDPDVAEGLALFHRLVADADFLFESAAPGDGRPAWLDPKALAAVNPRLIHVTVSPFGLQGPKSAWADSEITLWASGGPLLPARDDEGRPLRISAPQAYLHAAGDAAGGALIAHFARVMSGQGQHVDISVQQSVAQATLSAVLAAGVDHANFLPRPAPPSDAPKVKPLDLTGSGALTRRTKWPVRGGLAEMHLSMGSAVGLSTNALFAWMRAEGAPPSRFFDWDWPTLPARIKAGEITEADVEAARDAVEAFLSTRDKSELMTLSLEHEVRVAPIQTTADILASGHEQARGFLQTIKGPFGDYVLPGDFAMGGGFTPLTPAPRLGEHNGRIYGERLGLDADALAGLHTQGVI